MAKHINPVILVVEDEMPLQRAVVRKLENYGFDVVTARAVDQAINLLSEIKIDVIWLDHYLYGELDGIDLMFKLKNNLEWKSIPVFVVSNTASDEKVKSYLRLGIAKYLVKANYQLEKIVEDIASYMKDGESVSG